MVESILLDTATSAEGVLLLCSGRCGSTVVADLLADRPDTLPILEFFYAQFQDGIPKGTATGEEFWSMITRPWRALNTVVALGRIPAEVRYKIDDWAQAPELSGLLAFTLPAISDEPDDLLVELGSRVPDFPTQPYSAHYHQLFTMLCHRFGKQRWVEKSAGSCLYAPALLPMFPDAKIVYLERDCVDTAVSMTHHPMFQLAELRVDLTYRVGADPYGEGFGMTFDELDPEVARLLPDRLDTDVLDERAGSQDSLIRLVMMQAAMTRETVQALDSRPVGQVLRIRYEDLVARPFEQLYRLGTFLELPECEEWAHRSSLRIRRPTRARAELETAQRNMLNSIYYSVINAPDNPLAAFV